MTQERNKMSLHETISTITMEYLKPKYPIYKIDMIENSIIYNDDDIEMIQTIRKTEIVEVNDDADNWRIREKRIPDQFDSKAKLCSSKFIEICIKNIKEHDALYNCPAENFKVISCERIA